MKDKITNALSVILEEFSKEYEAIKTLEIDYSIIIPDNKDHGDYSVNIAMKLSRYLRKSPKDVAEDIVSKLRSKNLLETISKIEVAGAGFINFYIDKSYYAEVLKDIVTNDNYFHIGVGKNKRVLIEYVSANPTGPLHIGHGRGAAYGDSLARLLSYVGYNVDTEYYINDAGNQMNNLGLSVYARMKQKVDKEYPFPENGYHGDYINDIADLLEKERTDILDIDEKEAIDISTSKAIDIILAEIEGSLKDFRVDIGSYYSEKTLYNRGLVDKVLDKLDKQGSIYEEEGALWFSSSKYCDDKDRVLKKSSGEYTYLSPDIAYHDDKYDRGYDLLIDIWGADHHGYVSRMRSAIEALGYNNNAFKVQLIQMVSLIKDGSRVSMSTRSGEFIPLSYLLDEVGVDATRYFYNMRSFDSQFDFDLDLAKSKSSDNPVYYVQYGHARAYSLLSNAKDKGHKFISCNGLDRLILDSEIQIIKFIMKFKDILRQSAESYEPHRIAYYLQELASLFHSYYYANRVIVDDDKILTDARLTLAMAVAKSIKTGLEILGVNSPERM